jgi:hypothetical protein
MERQSLARAPLEKDCGQLTDLHIVSFSLRLGTTRGHIHGCPTSAHVRHSLLFTSKRSNGDIISTTNEQKEQKEQHPGFQRGPPP